MRRLILILALLFPSLVAAQGQQITVGPFSKAGLVYVCPVPSGGTPCPSPSSIFSDSALTQALSNPFSIPTQAIVTFYAASGQYTIEMPASGTQQVIGGGGGGAPTINTVYVSASCSGATNCFTVFDDVQSTTSAIYTASSTTVGTQSTDPAFVSTDAGKIDFGTYNCPGTVNNCNDNCPQSTIQSVTDAHHVVVGIACTNNSTAGASNNFFWGHDDGSTLVSAFATVLNGPTGSSQRQNLSLPCGVMFTGSMPFIIPSGVRNFNGGISGCGGGGTTTIIPLPKMNCNATGSNGCLIGDLSQPLETTGANLPGWVFRDITFWGGGTDVKDSAATYSNPATGILTNPFDALYNVFVIGWVWNNATPVIGISGQGSTWYNSGSVAGGTAPCQLAGLILVPAVMFGGTCGGSFNGGGPNAQPALKIVSTVNNIAETNGVYINQGGSSGITNAGATGSVYYSKGDHITVCYTNQSGTAFLTGTTMNQDGSGCTALTVSGGVVHLSSVDWRSTGGTFSITGGTVFDDCGVAVPTTGTAGTFSGGTVLGNCSMPDLLTNPVVASRNTTLASTVLVPAIRLPYTGPMTVKLYAYDSAAGTSCTGNTTVTWTISYTDNTGTAQTQTATETITTNGGATGGDKLSTTFTFSTNGVTAVTYSTTYAIGTGCVTGPSYAAQLAVT